MSSGDHSAPNQQTRSRLTSSMDPKNAVAKHVAGLATDIISGDIGRSQRLPDHITGVRRQYLEAIQAEADARRKYEFEVARSLEPQEDDIPQQTDEELLVNHVNALRQKQQHGKLDSLAHYVNEFEALLPPARFPKDDYHPGTIPASEAAKQSNNEEQKRIEGLIRNLEAAVMEAKNKSAQEQLALKEVQAAVATASVTPNSQLQAMNAVRSTLNAWVEENLAACGIDESTLHTPPAEMDAEMEVLLADVEKAYAEYIEVRKRVVAAADDLTPLAEIEEGPAEKVKRTRVAVPLDATVNSERRYPYWQDKRSATTLGLYTQAELKAEDVKTGEILQRLADESQLLPSYPILAQADRLKRKPLVNGHARSNMIDLQVDAWDFAAEAAENTTNSAVGKDLKRSKEAIEAATETMQDIILLHGSALGGS